MIVCFNKKGIIKEQLDSYGNLPRVGSQTYQIFAYFDGVDLSNYGSAYIKLYRPDYSGSAYPILFMNLGEITFKSGVSSNFFTAGQKYIGYVFDFSKVRDTKGTATISDDTIVTLLDTPGQWKAVITLVSNGLASNVVGTVSFNVGGVPSNSDDETVISLDVVVSTMANIITGKLDKESAYYVREVSGFEAKAAAGQLPASYFVAGSLAFDESNLSFYKLLTVTANESADGYVYCSSYTKIALADSFLSLSGNSAAHPMTGELYFASGIGGIHFGIYGAIGAAFRDPEGEMYLEASGGTYCFGSGNVVEGEDGSYHPTFTLDVSGLTFGHRTVSIPGEDGTLATREWCNANLVSDIDIEADLDTPYTYIFSLKDASGRTIDSASITLASEQVTEDLESYIDNAVANASFLPLSAGSSKPLTGDLYLSGDRKIIASSSLYLEAGQLGESVVISSKDGPVVLDSNSSPEGVTQHSANLYTTNLTSSKEYQFPNDTPESGSSNLTLATREWVNSRMYQHNMEIIYTYTDSGGNSQKVYVRFTLTDHNIFKNAMNNDIGYGQLGDYSILNGLAESGYDGSGLYSGERLAKALLANGYRSDTNKRIVGVFKQTTGYLGLVYEDGTEGRISLISNDVSVRDFFVPFR